MDGHDAQVRGLALAAVAGAALACGGVDPEQITQPSLQAPNLYASEVLRFEPGPHAGFGAERFPEIVLGAPAPGADGGGSLDVLSLGVGGVIELGFGAREIVDGPGPDIVVFENAFEVATAPGEVFAELGRVSVSEDGETWHAFACDPDPDADPTGCAGARPTAPFDVYAPGPLDPEQTGGDAFDLAELGLEAARFVRIEDLAERGKAPSGGFDLDAVGLVHLR